VLVLVLVGEELLVSTPFSFCLSTVKEAKGEVDSFIPDLGIEAKRDERSGTLSGGQKRALSVALAFAGGSEVVILDEPTSGRSESVGLRHWWLVLTYTRTRHGPVQAAADLGPAAEAQGRPHDHADDALHG
jgi:ABC-type branched-subunit amino acid transport system ATPase component